MATLKTLEPGDIVHGFVGGAFGRDHYSCFRVEAVGLDWVVGRTISGSPYPVSATGKPAVAACQKAREDYSYCSPHCGTDEY